MMRSIDCRSAAGCSRRTTGAIALATERERERVHGRRRRAQGLGECAWIVPR
jgi:hypothetical protein